MLDIRVFEDLLEQLGHFLGRTLSRQMPLVNPVGEIGERTVSGGLCRGGVTGDLLYNGSG